MVFDSTQTITQSAGRFFSGTFLSRLSGLARDMSMAAIFGSDPAIAALLIAFRFSNLFRRLFGEGALHSAFVPFFEEKRKESTQQAAVFFRNVSILLSLILIILTIVVETFLVCWLNFGNLSSDTKEIIYLTAILFPSLFFICHMALNSSLLQCERIFFVPAVSPVAFNVIWIIATFSLKGRAPIQAVAWLAFAIIFGVVCQWMITLPQTIGFLYRQCSFNFLKEFKDFSYDFISILKPLSLGILGVGATQINSALDPLFARYADLQGPAYLWYAIRIYQVPLAFFGVSLAAALLPPFSRAYKAGDHTLSSKLLDFAFRRSIGLMVPCTMALFVIGPSMINLLYFRGQFDLNSAWETSICLWGYTFSLIPATLVLLIAPVFYAQNRYKVTTTGTITVTVANILLNTLFVFGFRLGAFSVALATSLSAWLNFFLLYINLKTLRPHKLFETWKKVGLCSLFVSLYVFFLKTPVLENASFIFLDTRMTFPSLLINQVLTFIYQVFMFAGGLFLLAKVFKVQEILSIIGISAEKKIK